MKPCCRALLLMVFLLFPVLAKADGPRLQVDEAEFNFGQVFQGTKVEHTFRFRNAGDAPLSVDKVRSSCGCTAALVSSTLIPPGESGEIRTTFDSGRFRGAVVKTVYLYVNDPARPVTQFHLRGTVKPEIALEPDQIDLGTLPPGAAVQAILTLTNQGDREVSFVSSETTDPELKADLGSKSLAPGQSARLTVTATPKEGKSRIGGYVLVKTNSSRTPELRIPVTASVAGSPAGR